MSRSGIPARGTRLVGDTPAEVSEDSLTERVELNNFCWQGHCRRLYQLPVAA
jgi:hypothetical protein